MCKCRNTNGRITEIQVTSESWVTFESWGTFESWVTFETCVSFESWVTFESWARGGQTITQTDTHTHQYHDSQTGLGAGPIEKAKPTIPHTVYHLIFQNVPIVSLKPKKKHFFCHGNFFYGCVWCCGFSPWSSLLLSLSPSPSSSSSSNVKPLFGTVQNRGDGTNRVAAL